MKYVTMLTLSLFLVSMSVFSFASEPVQVKQPEQKIETEASGKGEYIKEAKELPSTMMMGEEKRSGVMQEVEELREGYVYDEDLQDD